MVKGDFALSLSDWSLRSDRLNLLDYVVTFSDYDFLVLTPQPPKLDLGTFFRPFSLSVWTLLLPTSVMLFSTMLLKRSSAIHRNLEPNNSSGIRTATISAMLFLVLCNSYYGGALTMFFSTDVTVAFQTIDDVVRDPSWKLMIRKGNIRLHFGTIKLSNNKRCQEYANTILN